MEPAADRKGLRDSPCGQLHCCADSWLPGHLVPSPGHPQTAWKLPLRSPRCHYSLPRASLGLLKRQRQGQEKPLSPKLPGLPVLVGWGRCETLGDGKGKGWESALFLDWFLSCFVFVCMFGCLVGCFVFATFSVILQSEPIPCSSLHDIANCHVIPPRAALQESARVWRAGRLKSGRGQEEFNL